MDLTRMEYCNMKNIIQIPLKKHMGSRRIYTHVRLKKFSQSLNLEFLMQLYQARSRGYIVRDYL